MGIIEVIEDAYFKHDRKPGVSLYLICSYAFFDQLDETLQRLTPQWGQNFEKSKKKSILRKIMGMTVLRSEDIADSEPIVVSARKAG